MKSEPLVIAAMFLAVAFSACGLWQEAKPIIKTIDDLAYAACVMEYGDPALKPKLGGSTAEEFCKIAENVRPFLEAQRSAQRMAKASLSGPTP